ncbi:MAG: threonine--tRNA ligase [Pseudomonadota bacterium]|jgi:threonyl-tRNA synthetase|nr:threonine--tRNA ligase [Pseudomonadota bacterium]NLX30242.1 threonine--tRNA ligase [Deltaproteobacteria bacterium]HNU84684.1 threonine--tRNA ligase [Syntrophales bacterium]HNZ33983.1 threonine--tRNA ligase [Syntrophales bacterium]HOF73104.1 threonine--tRNA ligase [Syntrophales bacterium]
MSKIDIHFPDNSRMTFDAGLTAGEILAAWKAEAARDAVAAKLNDRMIDLASPVTENGSIQAVDINTPEGVGVLRHSISHVMAEAVQQLFPNVKVTIGPSIEDGFYYDFDCESTFTPEDLKKIEKRMAEIAAKDEPFTRREVSREEAIELFEKKGEPYKVELIQDLPADVRTVSLYTQGDFTDLCRGPHIPATGKIKAFKLLNVAGAYWRGDEHNKMLQRIYGTGFATTEQMEEYLAFIEEAKRRDHRKLGRELDLFQINEEVGPGLIIWHPKGAMLRTIIEDWERKEHFKRGYDIVLGPQILRDHMWIRSGHMDHYKESMYFTEVEDQGYGIKPMNCLSHMMIYKSKIRSYRDLPLRYFELGTVHRHEKTGVLHGLTRVRQFTQDDAHILCTPEQLNSEILAIADFVKYAMGIFGFEYEVELSTRPPNSIGSDKDWEMATAALEQSLKDNRMPYEINEGDGAFYGPKIDFKLKDALKRKWQCATIQCDFALPERFDLHFVGADGERHRPVMLHRVILGSIERFIGVLIEHYAGAFPVWLAPVQAVLLTVTDSQIPYGEEVFRKMLDAGLRVERDFKNEKLGHKIRAAQLQKVPYMLVIGDKEVGSGTVSPRQRDGKNLGAMPVDAFIDLVRRTCSRYE